MTPAEHYQEAERLTQLALDGWNNPEGGYEPGPVSPEEVETRLSIAAEARADAVVLLAAAQVHAALAAVPPQHGPAGGYQAGDEVTVVISGVTVEGLGDYELFLDVPGIADGLAVRLTDDDGGDLPQVRVYRTASAVSS